MKKKKPSGERGRKAPNMCTGAVGWKKGKRDREMIAAPELTALLVEVAGQPRFLGVLTSSDCASGRISNWTDPLGIASEGTARSVPVGTCAGPVRPIKPTRPAM